MTADKRLDRVVQFDERSRNYPIRALVAGKPPRTRQWHCNAWLDQGSEGACVGFGWSHEFAATPAVNAVTNATAQKLYKQAQTLDEWAGEDYSGTSVIAGAKAAVADGYMREYRWAFGIDDVILALSHAGPVVLGLNWYSGMFDPDANGLITPSGNIAGGHCILALGYDSKKQLIRLHNSWGKDWGIDGECYISVNDLSTLLKDSGEACVPVGRKVGAK
jgi:hypothetical protein